VKLAIVGAGVSGLVCAHLLSERHDVTVFEANDYAGGHTHTVRVDTGDETHRVDTGFIVLNDRTYPNFERLLARLEEDRQVAAVDDARALVPRRVDEIAEVRVELGSAAGQVDGRRPARAQVFEDLVHGLPRHRLRAARPRVYVAMHARLVAHVPEVHLQGVDASAIEGGKIGAGEEGKRGVHRRAILPKGLD